MSHDAHHYDAARTLLKQVVLGLVAIAILLGVLHLLFSDVKVGGVSWFHLDKERNLPTWYSGALFFSFGIAALVSFYWEVRQNRDEGMAFRLPGLWLCVAALGLLASLDETTILHENLFWREVRQVSDSQGEAWRHLTQWQVVFAPLLLVAFGYLTILFSQRFWASRAAARASLAGVTCWLTALLLEGLRGFFKLEGPGWYQIELVAEEELEMFGAILLAASIASYAIDISLGLHGELRERLARRPALLGRRGLLTVAILVGVSLLLGGLVYQVALHQAATDAPVAKLFRKALEEKLDDVDLPPIDASTKSKTLWFGDLEPAKPPSEEALEAIKALIVHGLPPSGGVDLEAQVQLTSDSAARAIFVSLSNGRGGYQVGFGLAKGYSLAINQAMTGLRKSWPAEDTIRWIRLDVVDRVDQRFSHGVHSQFEHRHGVDGIAFDGSSRIAFHPTLTVAESLVSKGRKISVNRILAYLEAQDPAAMARFRTYAKRKKGRVYRFTTRSYLLSPDKAVRLHRGTRMVSDFTPDYLVARATLAGRYLTRAVQPDGTFNYEFLPKSGRVKDTYNLLRHAGAVYAMCQLQARAPDAALLRAAERGVGYLLKQVASCAYQGKTYACVIDDGDRKLGGNALAILALTQHRAVTGDNSHLAQVRALADWLVAVQEADGRFAIHKQKHKTGKISDFRSDYYPGEAILALVQAHVATGARVYLDAAERGAGYLLHVRDRGKARDQLEHDHWLMMALEQLHLYRVKSEYVRQATDIGLAIAQSQITAHQEPDYVGSYYEDGRSTPAATRSEGLAAALRLARRAGWPKRAVEIEAALRAGILFQLRTQLLPETVMFLPHPNQTLGAFRHSLINYKVRIDYVQHNISALLAAAALLGPSPGLSAPGK